MRPYWTGQIRLSLVSLPVEIYPAITSHRAIPLHEIYRVTGERIRHQNVASEEPVERKDIVKGYEYQKGEHILIDPEEIKKLKIPSRDTLEIVQFVDAGEINELYFDKPYFVVPKNPAAENAFVTIREGLRITHKYGLGQLVFGGRERLCALKPCGRGMLLEVIRYMEEVREADAYFSKIHDIKIEDDQLDLAVQLIKQKTTKFDPERFHDHYHEALRELIDAKLAHRPVPKHEEKRPATKVTNIMDALRRSLEEEAPERSSPRKKATVTRMPTRRPKAR
jgi:DNA end-binding protein Ku